MTKVMTTTQDPAAAPTMGALYRELGWAPEAVDAAALIEALKARTRWAAELTASQDAMIAGVKPPRRPVGIHQA